MDINSGIWPPDKFEYSLNGRKRRLLYYLADGVYPHYPIFARPFSRAAANTRKKRTYNRLQEAIRKHVERLYGVITARFQILERPARFYSVHRIVRTSKALAILHNMVVIERRGDYISRRRLGAAYGVPGAAAASLNRWLASSAAATAAAAAAAAVAAAAVAAEAEAAAAAAAEGSGALAAGGAGGSGSGGAGSGGGGSASGGGGRESSGGGDGAAAGSGLARWLAAEAATTAAAAAAAAVAAEAAAVEATAAAVAAGNGAPAPGGAGGSGDGGHGSGSGGDAAAVAGGCGHGVAAGAGAPRRRAGDDSLQRLSYVTSPIDHERLRDDLMAHVWAHKAASLAPYIRRRADYPL